MICARGCSRMPPTGARGWSGWASICLPGEHPIVPVMLGEAQLAQDMAARLFEERVYVSGFFFPVVPRGKARIRTQMNAALTRGELDRALTAFEVAGKAVGVLA